jgi:cytochrome c oxidase subunit II
VNPLLQAVPSAHNALSPASPQAATIAALANTFFVVAAAIWLLVLAFLTYSLIRARRLGEREQETGLSRRQTLAVSSALAISTLMLVAIGALDYGTGRRVERIGSAGDTVKIRLVGHQWWWEVQYEQSTPPYRITTANELHVPVGRPVLLRLESRDVIHSFWAPNLHGKSDLIPGYTGTLTFQADKAGVYAAPCAEYCGAQHAKMSLLVVAEGPAEFDAWYANEQRNARAPATAVAQRGQDVFARSACSYCHTIRGAAGGGVVAPDLTHVGARRTLAAGAIPNRRDALAGWIMNSQGVKPGNQMPPMPLAGHDLEALLDYLTNLR